MEEPGATAAIGNAANINAAKAMEEVEEVDVVVVLDATGSMQTWIDSARTTVLEAFAELQRNFPLARFRLGCVCYRDIGDRTPFVIMPLSSDFDAVQLALRKVHASGGNDTAEDVAGALQALLELEWNAVATKTVLWVADAPAHGLAYHGPTVGDRFPKGDPEGREPSVQVRTMAERGMDLTLFRIDASMDKMIERFAEAYQGTEATFTMLDVVKQAALMAEADPSCRFDAIDALDAVDAVDDSFKDLSRTRSRREFASIRSPSDDTFRYAAESAVSESIQKSIKKKAATPKAS